MKEHRRLTEVSRKGKEEEDSCPIPPQTCNGGLISKHVMYFTPRLETEGGEGEEGGKNCRDGGSIMAGRRWSAYRLPSQQVSSSNLFPPPCPPPPPPPPLKNRTQVLPYFKTNA